MRAALIVAVLLLLPAAARAQVGVLTTDAFDLADHAAAIAFVEPADGGVRVVQPVAGDATIFAHLVPEPPPPPPPDTHVHRGRDRGRRVIFVEELEISHDAVSVIPEVDRLTLAFVTTNGGPVNPGGRSTISVGDQRVDIDPAAQAAWTRVIQRWTSDHDPGARARLLMSVVAPHDRLATHAILRLLSDARLLTSLDHAARMTLLHAAAAVIAAGPGDFLTVQIGGELPRLHEPDAVPVVISAFRNRLGVDVSDGLTVGVALESLTNHLPPADQREQTDAWLAWVAHVPWRTQPGGGEQDRNEMLAFGWKERGFATPGLRDVGWLATRIRSGPDELDREVATDLCEQLRGRNIAGPPSAIDAAAATNARTPRPPPTMSQLADACGAP